MRAVAGVQVRLATPTTSDDYVAGKLWQFATLPHCPWHPQGHCGFCRHGTYERIRPPGTQVARWYCPLQRRTVSALPDCLASHYSGTLADLEAIVVTVEQAPSRSVAAEHVRTEIELPGALRYLDRLCHAVHDALVIIRGLDPPRFGGLAPTLMALATVLAGASVLMALREHACDYLPELRTPLGFNPPQHTAGTAVRRCQHPMGPDPPSAYLHPSAQAGRRPEKTGVHR